MRRPLLLRDLQSGFADALFDSAATPTCASLIRAGKLSPARRLEIYRHNVLSNLRGTLAEIYPVVRAIVGEAFFRHAAEQFIAACPSRSGDLNQFGQAWADFLSSYAHAYELPYLADVARLEWAWHESFHAADHAPFDLTRLAAVPPAQHGELGFQLHPSVRRLHSSHPLLRIWQVNQPDYTGDMAVDWDGAGDNLLIHRQGVEVSIRQLAAGPWQFLSALAGEASLEQAADRALAVDAEFDLQGFLFQSVQSEVIVNFTGT